MTVHSCYIALQKSIANLQEPQDSFHRAEYLVELLTGHKVLACTKPLDSWTSFWCKTIYYVSEFDLIDTNEDGSDYGRPA